MIKAKKTKIILSVSLSLAAVVSAAAITGFVALNNRNNKLKNDFQTYEKNINNSLNSEIKSDDGSSTSARDNLPKKDFNVVVTYKDNDQIIKQYNITTNDLNNVNIEASLPEGYELVDSNINLKHVNLSEDNSKNVIYVRPKKIVHKTTLIFKLDANTSQEFKKIVVETINNELLDYQKYIPEGYHLVSENPTIIIDKENVLVIAKNVSEYKTIFNFKYNGENIDTQEIISYNDQAVVWMDKLPQGYKIKTGFQIPEVLPGNTYDIQIEPKIVKHSTTVIYQTQEGLEISRKVFETNNEDKVEYQNFVPDGYHLVNQENEVKIDQENIVIVAKNVNEFTTTFNFIYNNKTIESAQVKSENDNPVLWEAKVPTGYQINREKSLPEIKPGGNYDIEIEPIVIKHETIIIFKTNDGQQILEQSVTTINNDPVEWKSLMPKGYHLVGDEKNVDIKVDQTNELVVAKDIVKYTTTINFKEGGRLVERVDFTTYNNDPIDWKAKIPSGYKLVNDNNINITPGETIDIQVEQILIKHKTQLKFVLQNKKVIQQIEVETTGDEKIKLNQYVPIGYHLANSDQKINLDQLNEIVIALDTVTYHTTFNYVNGSETISSVIITTKNDQEVNWQAQIPSGYKLKPGFTISNLQPGKTYTVSVVNDNIKDVDDDKPKPLPKEEEKVDITPYVAKAGPNIDVNNIKVDEPKITTGESKGKEVSAADAKIIKNAFADIQKLSGIVVSGKLSEADINKLADAYKAIYEMSYTNDGMQFNNDYFKDYIKFINDPKGNPNFTFPGKRDGEDYAALWKTMMDNYIKQMDSFLAKGMIPVLHLGSMSLGNTWGPINPADNKVRNKMIQDNKNRILSNDSEYNRNPSAIVNNEFIGWKKSNATSEYERYGASSSKGINVYRYTPAPSNKYAIDNNLGDKIFVVLDAANPQGYASFIQFMNDVVNNNKQLDGVIIQNMGKFDEKQDFKNILASIPSVVKSVTLFFEGYNTASLIGLHNKKIQELQMYSGLNNISDKWAIDPNSINDVKNIVFEYNNNYMNNKDQKVAGGIVFNTLKYTKGSNLAEINAGQKIAFVTKGDQRVFQGAFGEGSWPTYLDFSEVPEIQSLKDINLYGKVFYQLTLFAKSNVFEVTGANLVKDQWNALIVKGPTRSKLIFKGGAVDSLYIKGNISDLPNGYNAPLYGLLEAGRYEFSKYYVDNQAMADVLNQTQAARKFNVHFVVKPASLDNNDEGFDYDF
ncbi:putative immunoglobulin-blocking virulence protein [[Mycoplasma] falconis]|uniref:Putative immunoglobulin-blocking virulence protein n=1 Tax=[Mycoplasma] falconis TaxID=92403 RepID=A0A501XA57_9BACT|nr:putative immunoglobulin-blocking virulence protein [[Mycoplasma] falconis]TPE57263.1 putative immunoglobulin-blocking virulence protein [[Mycoplasma] falconis]